MGLDNIWSRHRDKATDEHPQFDPPLDLVVGILGDPAQGWFRGKCYEHFVLAVTGVSLYQEWIPNRTARKMAAALREFVEHPRDLRLGGWEPDPGEITELARMFTAYAEDGWGIIGWW